MRNLEGNVHDLLFEMGTAPIMQASAPEGEANQQQQHQQQQQQNRAGQQQQNIGGQNVWWFHGRIRAELLVDDKMGVLAQWGPIWSLLCCDVLANWPYIRRSRTATELVITVLKHPCNLLLFPNIRALDLDLHCVPDLLYESQQISSGSTVEVAIFMFGKCPALIDKFYFVSFVTTVQHNKAYVICYQVKCQSMRLDLHQGKLMFRNVTAGVMSLNRISALLVQLLNILHVRVVLLFNEHLPVLMLAMLTSKEQASIHYITLCKSKNKALLCQVLWPWGNWEFTLRSPQQNLCFK